MSCGNIYQIRLKQVVEDDSPFTDIEIELDGYYEEFKRLLHIGDIQKVDVPTSLNATLRPYQQHGIEWLLYLRKLGFGALLADDMGLGKSIQTISYLLYKQSQNRPALIVAPTSVLWKWQKFERFAPNLRVQLHYGNNRDKGNSFEDFLQSADVVLTSYALAQLDEEELTSLCWDAVILDEAQNIKNPYETVETVQKLTSKSQKSL